jgi:predicted 3-demethylubiquinone-9 3-methyltransferase (glyoxalase superfamily)
MSANKITPFLWFDFIGTKAVDFYQSVFKDFKRGAIVNYGPGEPGPEGEPMTIEFSLLGQDFVALNGGPDFKFNESVSFAINCNSQDEIDYYWEKLTEDGGEKSVCGWVKDKFGLAWQVNAASLDEMLKNGNAAQRSRVMQAMLKMKKLDIATLEEAYAG